MNVNRRIIALLAVCFFTLGMAFMSTVSRVDLNRAHQEGYAQAKVDYQIVNVPGEPPSPFMVLTPCYNSTLVNFTLVNQNQ